jgi:hypothetical protein
MTAKTFISLVAPLALAAACATKSQVLTGTPRNALASADVTIYTQAPAHFEEIAILRGSRKSFSSGAGELAVDKIIGTMKVQAAQLGANGVLLEELADSNAIGLATGVESQTYTHNASVSLGVGASLGVVKKSVIAKAIFVAHGNPDDADSGNANPADAPPRES